MVQGQGVNDMKDSLSLTLQQNKLERLSPTSNNLAFARKTPSVALQSNIMQNWKILQFTNTLAYFTFKSEKPRKYNIE